MTLYTTISCRVRLMKIWGQGESKPVFSKVHLDIFKCKMQWLFMFHSLLSLTWHDNFFQADLHPEVPGNLGKYKKLQSLCTHKFKEQMKSLTHNFCWRAQKILGTPSWVVTTQPRLFQWTYDLLISTVKGENAQPLPAAMVIYCLINIWVPEVHSVCGCVCTCLIW